ncbi:hypothetical protein PR048_011046 [Dryococelus australis]|uniref:Reverse transcriptase RNase H-like domain-containing protein n=1 Tax=Dryococelus australis TaxID=614101 RepID=A0ABQ9HKG5_9NEOP|nr:hypothetical protein PR048_011046 [Dryococelus australis]
MLSKAEKNRQLQEEALNIIFAVKKFHKDVYGCKFVLYTDHQPLVAILGPTKDVPCLAGSRMQHWVLLLSGYNYEDMGNVDALSRLLLPHSELVEQPVYSVSVVHNELLQPRFSRPQNKMMY